MSVSASRNPFSRTSVLLMLVIGFIGFLGLLYSLGAGDAMRSTNNGQAHGASNSLVGYKAFSNLLAKDGKNIRFARSAAGYNDPGLLVLTPGYSADAEELASLIDDRRFIGATLVILPKWLVTNPQDLKPGWVKLVGPLPDAFSKKLLEPIGEVKVNVAGKQATKNAKIVTPFGPPLKNTDYTVSFSGGLLEPMITNPSGEGALVSLYDNGGYFPELLGGDIPEPDDADYNLFPVVIVAEPDLFNNMGLADKARARHALNLVGEMSYYETDDVTFDLTMVGLGSSENLLTLAFRPPFLSATICLIVAALAAAWMAFNRFGPPSREARAIDYGKGTLVNNMAGFVQRLDRDYLLAMPYADLIQQQSAAAIGLPAGLAPDETEEQLNKLGSYEGKTFSVLASELRAAQKRHEIAARAAALYRWKKEMIG